MPETGKVCIKQDQGVSGDLVLIFEEREVDHLISLLNAAKAEIAEDRRVAEENEAN